MARQQSSLKKLRHPHGHSYKSRSAQNAFPSNLLGSKTIQLIQIWSLVAISQAFPLASSVSTENQGSQLCSYTEKLTPRWNFISNGNKRYDNSVFPTNQQIDAWLCSCWEKLVNFPHTEQFERCQVSSLQKPKDSNWIRQLAKIAKTLVCLFFLTHKNKTKTTNQKPIANNQKISEAIKIIYLCP